MDVCSSGFTFGVAGGFVESSSLSKRTGIAPNKERQILYKTDFFLQRTNEKKLSTAFICFKLQTQVLFQASIFCVLALEYIFYVFAEYLSLEPCVRGKELK